MSLTKYEVNYLQTLKEKGASKEEAMEKLSSLRAKTPEQQSGKPDPRGFDPTTAPTSEKHEMVSSGLSKSLESLKQGRIGGALSQLAGFGAAQTLKGLASKHRQSPEGQLEGMSPAEIQQNPELTGKLSSQKQWELFGRKTRGEMEEYAGAEAAPENILEKELQRRLLETTMPFGGALSWGQQAIEGATKAAAGGVAKVATGTGEIQQAVSPYSDLAPEERVMKGVTGSQGIIGGGLQTAFAPVSGAVEATPGVREAVGFGMEKLNEATQFGSDTFKQKLTDAGVELSGEQVQAIDNGFNILGQLFAVKYGKKAAESKILREGAKNVVEGAKAVGEPIVSGVTKTAEVAGEGLGIVKSKLGQVAEKGLEKKMAKTIDVGIEKSVRPSVRGRKTSKQVEQYREKGREAVKSIVKNKEKLEFKDEAGRVTKGDLPKSVKEFGEAIEQTKKEVFEKYDKKAKAAGDKGVKVELEGLAKELDVVIKDTVLQDTNPSVIKYAKEKADIYRKRGSYTTEQTQGAIKSYNDSLQAFYRNPSYDNFAKANIDALIVNKMRESLDKAIEGVEGKGYQALKNEYSALKAIEADVAHRAIVYARQNNTGLAEGLTNVGSGAAAVSGVLSMNPASLAGAAVAKGLQKWIKYVNNPDVIVKKMFKQTEKSLGKIEKGAAK